MTKHMQIRDKVYEKLTEIKGEGSYSDVIESLLNKSGIAPVEPVKAQTGASQPQTD